MKIRNIIASLLAVFCLAGCSETIKESLDEIQVSQSYVGISQNGGSASIKVNAAGSWSFDGIPGWLTVSPVSGGAGETTVTFSAEAAESTNQAELFLTCGTAVQHINVIQMADAVEPDILSVADAIAISQAIAKGDAQEQTIFVKGIVCRIDEISTSYGNATYYISDNGKYEGNYRADGSGDGNWFEIYRGYWLNGDKFTTGKEFGIGDEVVVKGVAISYNGIPETKQSTASVVSIKKSLIGIDGTELLGEKDGKNVTVFPCEGGSIKVFVTSKGSNGFHVVIPDEAKSWLHIEDFGLNYVTLSADANNGGERSVSVSFTTEADGTTYSCGQTLSQKGSIVAASIAEFLSAEVGDTQYRLTGVITSVANASYGNVYIRDWSGEVYVYGIGARGDFETIGLKVGDVVTLVGKRAAYNGTAQVGDAQHESHISVIEVSVEEFLSKEDNPNVYYMVTGTLDEIVNATYGNVYLADDKGNRVYSYGCYPGWGATGDARKDAVATLGLKVGDELTIIGPKSTYNGVTQINGGVYFSHKSAE